LWENLLKICGGNVDGKREMTEIPLGFCTHVHNCVKLALFQARLGLFGIHRKRRLGVIVENS
jgi:hypothetical protein